LKDFFLHRDEERNRRAGNGGVAHRHPLEVFLRCLCADAQKGCDNQESCKPPARISHFHDIPPVGSHNAMELVGLKVDVIVTAGATDTRAAKEATSTIPIVMTQDNDPV
jgi:hypothetical protein